MSGHTCNFDTRGPPNRPHNGSRNACAGYNESGDQCGLQITSISCIYSEKTSNYCDKHYKKIRCYKYVWDHDLSACANKKADELGFNIDEKGQINHTNIYDILGLSGDKLYHHISGSRRRAYDEYLRRMALEESGSEGDDEDIANDDALHGNSSEEEEAEEDILSDNAQHGNSSQEESSSSSEEESESSSEEEYVDSSSGSDTEPMTPPPRRRRLI